MLVTGSKGQDCYGFPGFMEEAPPDEAEWAVGDENREAEAWFSVKPDETNEEVDDGKQGKQEG